MAARRTCLNHLLPAADSKVGDAQAVLGHTAAPAVVAHVSDAAAASASLTAGVPSRHAEAVERDPCATRASSVRSQSRQCVGTVDAVPQSRRCRRALWLTHRMPHITPVWQSRLSCAPAELTFCSTSSVLLASPSRSAHGKAWNPIDEDDLVEYRVERRALDGFTSVVHEDETVSDGFEYGESGDSEDEEDNALRQDDSKSSSEDSDDNEESEDEEGSSEDDEEEAEYEDDDEDDDEDEDEDDNEDDDEDEEEEDVDEGDGGESNDAMETEEDGETVEENDAGGRGDEKSDGPDRSTGDSHRSGNK